jgi:hypothetical protein
MQSLNETRDKQFGLRNKTGVSAAVAVPNKEELDALLLATADRASKPYYVAARGRMVSNYNGVK